MALGIVLSHPWKFTVAWLVLMALLVGFCVSTVEARTGEHRDPKQRALFIKSHPCPANGHTHGRCPGYIVDHVKPLCAGGPDRPSNMQWQTIKEAKIKDRDERKTCARERRI